MRKPISLRAILVAVAAETVFILCATWVYAGMPGARHDTSAPSITIRFETPAPAPAPASRSA